MFNMGIIGFGGMAHHHFLKLKDYERVQVKGVYDVNPERCEFAKQLGLKAYSSKEELYADS